MESIKVKEIMVPLAEYATVDEEATLQDAVLTLEKAQQRSLESPFEHRALLVLDKDHHVVGEMSQLDALRGLESAYGKMGDIRRTSRSGFSSEFIRSMVEKYGLWKGAMADLCRKAAQTKVKNIMYAPTDGEYVEESATLDEAVHQLLMGHHQSLLVTRSGQIVGVLRLFDVFTRVCEEMKACQL
jgi:predicted transcriptional regulator